MKPLFQRRRLLRSSWILIVFGRFLEQKISFSQPLPILPVKHLLPDLRRVSEIRCSCGDCLSIGPGNPILAGRVHRPCRQESLSEGTRRPYLEVDTD